MRFEGRLGRSIRSFWATSYSFDLKLFDQYLLRRLSRSPLNAVVLADHRKLAAAWEHTHEGELYLARQVGRRYLLRGVRMPGGAAFHPKTYLFATAERAELVVGSGNLTRGGIDRGRETFAAFASDEEADLPSLRAWASWMSGLVDSQDDPLLRERWGALRESCPWVTGSVEGSRFLANDERPMLDQLATLLPTEVQELHVTAPFFDRDAVALGKLVTTCDPALLTLYVGAGVKVHGPSLTRVLKRARQVRVRRFEPRTFVHAKLIGAAGTNGSGVLMSGSPNISRRALTLAYGDGAGGNCETAVVREGTNAQIRDVFEGSGLGLVDEPLASLVDLAFDDDDPEVGWPIALTSARWREDGRIQLRWEGDPLPDEAAVAWEGAAPAPIEPGGVTEDPLNKRDPLPLLVSLVGPSGDLSNRVAVDDPAALQETLEGSHGKRSSRPLEIEGLAAAPLVQLVLWAHERFIFDPEDTAAFRRAHDAAGEAADAEDSTDLWERYARDELQHDPRSHTYRPLTSSGGITGPVDDLLRELQTMLHASPEDPQSRILRIATAVRGGEDPGDDGSPGAPWTMEARQQVRAFNLLMRWAAALADPRHALLSPEAPAINYETLIGITTLAWVNEAITTERLRKLLLALFEAFIGRDEGHGYLGRIDYEERTASLSRLDPAFSEFAAGLAYVAITAPGWRSDIYDWQPLLRRGVEFGVLRPGTWSETLVGRVLGDSIELGTIAELIAQCTTWVDEATWCRRLTDELGLQRIALQSHSAVVPVVAIVEGSTDPIRDTRLLTIARRVIDFRRLPAVAVRASGDTFVVEPGAPGRALVSGQPHRSKGSIDLARLREIEDQGGTWSDLLGLPRSAAA